MRRWVGRAQGCLGRLGTHTAQGDGMFNYELVKANNAGTSRRMHRVYSVEQQDVGLVATAFPYK